jgi:hypothetical protein
MVFVTRSTTNLPLQSRSYNTPGISGFMETTLKMDRTDFLGKMEGFSLQGLKGTWLNSSRCLSTINQLPSGSAKNRQQRVSQLRSQIRQMMNTKLSTYQSHLIIYMPYG